MFCSKCGLRITNESANFCKRCGNKLKNITSNTAQFVQNNQEDIFLRARKKLIEFTSPKIEKTRNYTANKIENLQKNIEDQSNYKQLSKDQRTFLAQRLASLRNKIALKDQTNTDFTIEEAQEIVTISDDLLEQIKDDKCLICYKPLYQDGKNKRKLIVCPHCGHGGHYNHIFNWINKHESCPYCKGEVKINEILILNV